ncbi:MAG: NFACT RNA binding domain-containing protein, partial [Bacilli bacterium]
LERKLLALQSDKRAAEAHIEDGAKGDAIFMKYAELNNRMSSFDYEGLTVELDPSRSLSGNAQLYYRRAKKAKETLKLNEANQAQTEKDLSDVQAALLQLTSCDEEGLEELAKELDISPQKSPQKKKSGDWRGLSHDSIPFEVDLRSTKILFGKSAKQNDCLTFLLDTVKDHLWFHVNGATGSHVMIKKENPTDEEIRTACEIALLNSGENDGDIIYTLRKNVRKGNVMGLAIVKDGKTIHLKSIRPETRTLLAGAERMKL